MRLNTLCLIGALTVLEVPLSAGAAPPGADRQPADAPQATPAVYSYPPGYYWEPDAYATHGKFRPAHCPPRW